MLTRCLWLVSILLRREVLVHCRADKFSAFGRFLAPNHLRSLLSGAMFTLHIYAFLTHSTQNTRLTCHLPRTVVSGRLEFSLLWTLPGSISEAAIQHPGDSHPSHPRGGLASLFPLCSDPNHHALLEAPGTRLRYTKELLPPVVGCHKSNFRGINSRDLVWLYSDARRGYSLCSKGLLTPVEKMSQCLSRMSG